MANKYFIFGATNNGDGTASNEAASNGAAGAWNNEAYLTGTAPTSPNGSLDAGDVVYIRSKTGNGANANKTFTVTTAQTIGNASATAAAPITWILDNGVTWSGINGVLEWDCNSATPNPVVAVRDYNRFIALEPDGFFVDYNLTDPNTRTILSVGTGAYVKHWKVDNETKTGTYLCTHIFLNNGAVAENCRVIAGRLAQPIIVATYGAHGVVINPTVELVYTAGSNAAQIFATTHFSNRGGKLTVIGGTITGAAASGGEAGLAFPGASVWAAEIEFYGTNYPKQMPLTGTFVVTHPQRIFCIGADGGYGSALAEPWGQIDSRNITYNYPVLNAAMPDSAATPWSWRMYAPAASRINPATLKIGKVYQSAAAAKTVTLELLTATTWAAALLNTFDIWMTVSYVKDSDDSVVTETTRAMFDGTALDTSSAGWDKDDWGAVTLNKKKLSLTTANAIKQNSMVEVILFWCSPAGSTNEQIFVCPDVQLT